MTARLLLVRHATTAETRRAAFPACSGAAPAEGDPALDRRGREQAEGLRGLLPPADRVWTSHAVRAIETAALAGLDGAEAVGDLAEGDFGRWAGRTPAEVAESEPDVIAAWYADPASAPHGGETFAQVGERARRVLARAGALGGTTVAVTHGGFVRAAVLAVLGLPVAVLWRLDAAPASVAELHAVPTPDGAGPAEPASWRVVRTNWTLQLPGAPESGVGGAGVSHTPGAHTPLRAGPGRAEADGGGGW